MPQMPSVSNKAYVNQANVGQAGGITPAKLVNDQNLSEGLRSAAKALTGVQNVIVNQVRINRAQEEALFKQEVNNTANKNFSFYLKDLNEGNVQNEGPDAVKDYLFSKEKDGVSSYQEGILKELNVDPNSKRGRRALAQINTIGAKNFMTAQGVYATNLAQDQSRRLYGFLSKQKVGVNIENVGQGIANFTGQVSRLNLPSAKKNEIITKGTNELYKASVENDYEIRKAELDKEAGLNDFEYKQRLKEVADESEAFLKDKVGEHFSGAEDIIGGINKRIEKDIEERAETEKEIDKQLKTVNERMSQGTDTSIEVYPDTNDGKLSALENRYNANGFSDYMSEAQGELGGKSNQASEATDNVNPAAYRLESRMMKTEVGAANANFVLQDGRAVLSPEAMDKLSGNANLRPYLSKINTDPVRSNPEIMGIWQNGSAQDKERIKNMFLTYEDANGATHFRFKNFHSLMMSVHGDKNALEHVYRGGTTEYNRENARESEANYNNLLIQFDSGGLTPDQMKRKLRKALEFGNITEADYTKGVNKVDGKLRSLKERKETIKLSPEAEKHLTAEVKTNKSNIRGAFINRFPGAFITDPMTQKYVLNAGDSNNLPIQTKLNMFESIASRHYLMLREKLKGKDGESVIKITARFNAKMRSNLANGYIVDPATNRKVYISDTGEVRKTKSEFGGLTDGQAFQIWEQRRSDRQWLVSEEGRYFRERVVQIKQKQEGRQNASTGK